jgi:hypothetical protein
VDELEISLDGKCFTNNGDINSTYSYVFIVATEWTFNHPFRNPQSTIIPMILNKTALESQ